MPTKPVIRLPNVGRWMVEGEGENQGCLAVSLIERMRHRPIECLAGVSVMMVTRECFGLQIRSGSEVWTKEIGHRFCGWESLA